MFSLLYKETVFLPRTNMENLTCHMIAAFLDPVP